MYPDYVVFITISQGNKRSTKMKIKVAILESDIGYLNRIVSVFSTKYSDKLELYSFTEQDFALASVEKSKIDVLIANESFNIDVSALPRRCGFAYFVDSADIESVHDQRAIGKFQKVDLIYKQILNVFSEKTESIATMKFGDDSTSFIAFSSVSGGCGSSSMAAACAMHFVSKGLKTLYLNLEKFGISESFFSAEGQFGMSDIIFALKSKKTNLPLKLESCVKQDDCGVFFFSSSKYALDMMELTTEDIIRLISEIRLMGSYNVVVLDLDFSIDKESLRILHNVNSVIWVGDGSAISNTKLYRAYQALSLIDQESDEPILNKVSLIYNKFSNKTGQILDSIGLAVLGGSPRYEHATTEMVLKQLVSKEMFNQIM